MKKLVLCCAVFGVFMVGLWAVSAANSNFAGTWVLDKSKSEGLPQNLASAENVTLIVTQDDKQLTAETKIEGGRGMPQQPSTYKLDGSETTSELSGQMSGKATLKAKWMDGGKVLELTTVANVSFQGNPVTINTKEHWELAEAGKALKIHRVRESPRGTQDYKLYFVKK